MLGWSDLSVKLAIIKNEEGLYVSEAVDFADALRAMKQGQRAAREGWNGKGMFIYRVQANSYPATSTAAKLVFGEDALVPYGAYYAMKTAQGYVVPWLASQTDLDAEDWVILED